MDYVKYFEAGDLPQEWSPQNADLLQRVHRRLLAGRTLGEVLDFVFDETKEAVPCDRIGLSFLEDGGQRLLAHWARADYEPVLLGKGYAGDMQGSSLQRVLATGAPRVINDLAAYLEANPGSHSSALLVREGVRSSMTCPLLVDGREVGFLFRSSRQPNAYTEAHVRLHQAMSELLAQAVEKAWRIEQLDAANHAYLEMLAFVSHEIKNPLGSMITQAGVLRDGLLGELQPKQQEQIGKIISKGHFLLGLVKDYLDLARLEGHETEPALTSVPFLATVIRPALEMAEPQILAANMRLTLQLPTVDPQVRCDPTLLIIVLNNLLGNAVKYGRQGGRLRLSVSPEGPNLTVSVWNEGPGFSQEQRSKLFRKFSRLQAPELLKQKGTGVGLYTSWKIVHLHQGTMDARSEEGQWAEFSFQMPTRKADPSEPRA
jgi:signal transduction histidine kinase